jgi:8-oxo-dGTP pyrophosphatase MutT (NUDIX family)
MELEDDPFVGTHQREHPNRNAAILIVINPENQLLLVRTRRLPNYWQPLGGGIDPDDLSAKDAAVREVKKEAGIEISPENIVHLRDAPYDFGTATVHSSAARLKSERELSFDLAEIAEARWFTLADAMMLPKFPAMARTLRSLSLRTELFL